MEIIREQLAKRPLMDASAKSLIKLLTVTSGYGEVRQLAAQKLEPWLQNPKVTYVCLAYISHTSYTWVNSDMDQYFLCPLC